MEQNKVPIKKRKGKWIATAAVILVVVIVAVSYILYPRTIQLVAPGTVIPLQGGHGYKIEFNASSAGKIEGSINSTNGFTIYVLTPSQYSYDSSTGSYLDYSYTTGNILYGLFSLNINSGIWYLVLYNGGNSSLAINQLTFNP